MDLVIKKYPDPVLRKSAAKIDRIDTAISQLLDEMARTMYINQGVGLAAVQVGIHKQCAVVNVGDGLIKIVNPVIIKLEGVDTQEEGCLSVPNTYIKVKRAKKITVNFLNERNEVIQLKADGILARAIQHEMDHLSGRLIIDHLHPFKKLLLKKPAGRGRVNTDKK